MGGGVRYDHEVSLVTNERVSRIRTPASAPTLMYRKRK